MDSKARQLSNQPSPRVVLKWEQRPKNEGVCNDITLDLTDLDILGTDNLIEIRDRLPDQLEVTIDLSMDNPRDAVSVRPFQLNKAVVKEVIVALLAGVLMAFFLWAGFPLVILLIAAALIGYYFGRGYITLH